MSRDVYSDGTIPFLPPSGMSMTIEDCNVTVSDTHWDTDCKSLTISFLPFMYDTKEDLEGDLEIWEMEGWKQG